MGNQQLFNIKIDNLPGVGLPFREKHKQDFISAAVMVRSNLYKFSS